jgi:2-polyprenyl-6-methoxyphenol hydroxylase-like FAD-dependent oxidoreductase
MTPGRALIIGGSIGGLLAANLLRRSGWDVSVFERASGDLSDRGAGIGTRDALFTVLRNAGLYLDAAIGVEVRSRLGIDREGRTVHEVPLSSISSAWAAIYRPLRAALPIQCYRSGAHFVRAEQDGETVTVILADGSRAQGELLVAADGLHSAVRAQFLPEAIPRYAGYVSWRVMANEHSVPRALHDIVFDHMVFAFPDEGMMLSTPVPHQEYDTARRCQIVWFLPASQEALALLCTDAEGRRHGLSIPHPLIRPAVVSELRTKAKTMLPDDFAAIVMQCGQPLLHPIFDLESPTLTFGRIVLLGDAAFVARPHVATGITKAALDAQGLVDALAAESSIDAAMARYGRERQEFGRWLVARGCHIGARLMKPLGPSPAMETTALQRMQIVMREYGAAGVVADETITSQGVVGAAM